MKFKYRLPEMWVKKVASMEEFANGATQVSIRLRNTQVIRNVLISMGTYLIAARGFNELPFAIDEISEIFQTEEDKNPDQRGGWDFWDNWE